MVKHVVQAVAVWLWIVGCATDDPVAVGGVGGAVVDAMSGQGIPGAVVYTAAETTMTGAGGGFSLRMRPADGTTISFEKNSSFYVPVCRTFGGDATPLRVALRKADPGTNDAVCVLHPNGDDTVVVGDTVRIVIAQDPARVPELAIGQAHEVVLELSNDLGHLSVPIMISPEQFDLSFQTEYYWAVPESILIRGAQDPATGAYSYTRKAFPEGGGYRVILRSYGSPPGLEDSSDRGFWVVR